MKSPSAKNKKSSKKEAGDAVPPKTAVAAESTEVPKSASLRTHLICFGVIVALAAACYSDAVQLDFVFDDLAAVVRNKDTNPGYPIRNLLLNDFWGNNISEPGSHKSYRPVTVWTFRMNRLWAEGWNGDNYSSINKATGEREYHHAQQWIAPSFHAVNIALHSLVSGMVYALSVAVVFPGDVVGSFVASALFASHPIHTEAVAGIVGRADLLSAALGIAAYMLYARGSKPTSTNWMLVALSMVLVWLANLSKEVGMMVFAVLGAHEVLLVDRSVKSLRDLLGRLLDRGRLAQLVARIAVIFVSGVGCLAFRRWITVIFVVPDIRHIENPIAYTVGIDRLYNLGMLHAKYMQLLIWPRTLSADWSYNCLPLVGSLWNMWNVYSAAMYVSLAAIAVACVCKLERGRRFLVPLVWMGATFFPSMNILFFVGTTIGERLLYVPSVGFCLVVGGAASYLLSKRRPAWLRALVLVCLVATVARFSVKTYYRNMDWKTDATVYRSAVAACPESAKAQMLYGQEMQVQDKFKESIPFLQRALEIEPDYCETAYSLGVALYRTGQIFPGLLLIQRGVQCNFTTPGALMSLFGVYSDLMRAFPEEDIVLSGYGDLLAKVGKLDDAAAAYFTLAKRRWDKGTKRDKEAAVPYSEKASSFAPDHCELKFWAGLMNYETGRLERAADLLEGVSDKARCPTTYVQALDRLVAIYNSLVEKNSQAYAQRQLNLIIRAQQVAMELRGEKP